MTKEREMGQRAQKGVEESSRTSSKGKPSNEKISTTGDIESSDALSSSGGGGGRKIGAQKNNGSPDTGGGGGKRQPGRGGGGGRGSKFSHGEESTRSLNGHQQPAQQNNRPKCRCWCCCCSCSCLALKNNEANPEPTESDPICDGDPLPSLEEIRTWGESFDKLMRSPGGRKVFRDFLKCEYSEENILFWLAVEELKKESRPEAIEEKARLIYEDYISILSPKEVSLDSRVREIVNQNMVDPNPHTFDEAQVQIYTLMHRDSYPRFVNSQMYKQLAQLNATSIINTQSQSSPTSDTNRGSVSNTASRKQSIAT